MASKKKPFDYFERRDKQRNLKKASKHLKRNRNQRPPRQRDWLDYADDDTEIESFERVMPRDEGERRRTVESLVEGAVVNQDTHNIEEISGITGTAIEVSSGLCRVWLDGNVILCSIRGSLTAAETGFSRVVAVGDAVVVSPLEDNKGIVEAVLPRHNQIARPDPSTPALQQIIVANIDQLLIVSSWRNPYIWTELIDRYLIAAERNDITAIICINKVDLVEDETELTRIQHVYEELGFPVIFTSAAKNIGLEQLRELLRGKVSAVAGLSGVGKSSLLAAVQPGFELRTGEVNEERGQGRHTTTQALMMPFGEHGFVIDTAGIRGFDLAGIRKRDLAAYYPEVVALAPGCHYQDCLHIVEPGCAVRAGLEKGDISLQRYHDYRMILESLRE